MHPDSSWWKITPRDDKANDAKAENQSAVIKQESGRQQYTRRETRRDVYKDPYPHPDYQYRRQSLRHDSNTERYGAPKRLIDGQIQNIRDTDKGTHNMITTGDLTKDKSLQADDHMWIDMTTTDEQTIVTEEIRDTTHTDMTRKTFHV